MITDKKLGTSNQQLLVVLGEFQHKLEVLKNFHATMDKTINAFKYLPKNERSQFLESLNKATDEFQEVAKVTSKLFKQVKRVKVTPELLLSEMDKFYGFSNLIDEKFVEIEETAH